ncbi:MAG: hypothetical protein K0A99_10420, partial [Desulfoarculaceae bacterium]|nr:hypothetical protein [Desulfoarculaceae bacterium]
PAREPVGVYATPCPGFHCISSRPPAGEVVRCKEHRLCERQRSNPENPARESVGVYATPCPGFHCISSRLPAGEVVRCKEHRLCERQRSNPENPARECGRG